MIKCPHCNEKLVIRCYYERWIDHPAVLEKDGIMFFDENREIGFSEESCGGEVDEFNDYECANCKENVKDRVGAKWKGGE